MNSVFIKLAGNKDRLKILDEFEFGPGRTFHYRVIRPWALPLTLNGGKWCLHLFSVTMNSVSIKLTGNEEHKILDEFTFWSYLTSHLGVMCSWVVTKWCLQLLSVTFDWIFAKLAGNEARHKSSNKFEFGPDRIIHFGVICSWAQKFFP